MNEHNERGDIRSIHPETPEYVVRDAATGHAMVTVWDRDTAQRIADGQRAVGVSCFVAIRFGGAS